MTPIKISRAQFLRFSNPMAEMSVIADTTRNDAKISRGWANINLAKAGMF
jgi:hypothetical protein